MARMDTTRSLRRRPWLALPAPRERANILIESVGTRSSSLSAKAMGTVWLARQSEPVNREVALKVIKPGMDSREVIARFEAERQALAVMNHRGIAKVFDGGTTERGGPFFVMEYVPGEPITAYCDRHLLTVRQRLRLFAKVCDAVQHAHQKGILHRDLKPSNVLISDHEGTAVPKIIDFGIAKALHRPLTEGVGGLEGLRAAWRQEPPRLSRRRAASPDEAQTIALRRGTLPGPLASDLRGDLDWVVAKAVDPDRGRRYSSAAALGDDIQRHLEHQPVEACPPTTLYRLGKLVKRRRGAVWGATAVLVALLAGLTSTTVMYLRAEERRGQAVRERELAEQINDFFNFDILIDSSEMGADVSIREVVDAAATQLDGRFPDRSRS